MRNPEYATFELVPLRELSSFGTLQWPAEATIWELLLHLGSSEDG
jgi:hypothetical protein